MFGMAMWMALLGQVHVHIKGQSLNLYLETHATTHDIYFIQLEFFPETWYIILACV